MSEKRETWEKALELVDFYAPDNEYSVPDGLWRDYFDAAIATLRATIEELTAERDAATKILIHWITAQGFDPNGGPEDEADWDIINAALVLQGMLPLDHPSIQAALCTETEGSEG